MAHITPVGWVDTSLVLANFRLRYHDAMEREGVVSRELVLWRNGEPRPVMEKFSSAKALIARLRNAAAPFLAGKPADLVNASIHELMPNQHLDWEQSEDTDLLRFEVALTWPPGCWRYCGGDAVPMAVGVLNYVNVAALSSMVNFSDSPCHRLLLDARRPAEA